MGEGKLQGKQTVAIQREQTIDGESPGRCGCCHGVSTMPSCLLRWYFVCMYLNSHCVGFT